MMSSPVRLHGLATDLARLHDALGWTSCQKRATLMMHHISIVWPDLTWLLQVRQTLILVLTQVTKVPVSCGR